MKYYTILDGPSADEIAPVYHTYSEQEILDMYWDYWYERMCHKFGKEHVDSNYSPKDCVDDWITVYWAWESTEENKAMTALIPTYSTRILMEKELYKLCYIDKCFAYFTTQDLDKQWGDDWDDAPYEHNAGEPYAPSLRYFTADRQEKVETDWNADGTPKWEIMKIAFYCPSAATPAELAVSSSSYSVQMINNKLIPWLTVYPDKALFAGASIDEFVEYIEKSGGEVFFPKSLLQVA